MGAWNPRMLLVTIAVSIVLIFGAAFFWAASRPLPLESGHPVTQSAPPYYPHYPPEPRPTATWTSWVVPKFYEKCLEAIDAADEAIREADARYEATLKALNTPTKTAANLREKDRQLALAKKANKEFAEIVVKEYIKQARECRKHS